MLHLTLMLVYDRRRVTVLEQLEDLRLLQGFPRAALQSHLTYGSLISFYSNAILKVTSSSR